jgi:hypothetical protein
MRKGDLRLLGKDGDSPLSFQQMGIEMTALSVDTAKFSRLSGLVQHGICQSGLSSVHMRHNPDHDVFFCIHVRNDISYTGINQAHQKALKIQNLRQENKNELL